MTRLIAFENGFTIDEKGFEEELLKQKTRSRKDAEKTTGDWNVIEEDDDQQFIGYDFTEATLKLNFKTLQKSKYPKNSELYSKYPKLALRINFL